MGLGREREVEGDGGGRPMEKVMKTRTEVYDMRGELGWVIQVLLWAVGAV